MLLSFLISGDGSLARVAVLQFFISCLVPPALGLLGTAAYGRRTGLLAFMFGTLYFPFIEYGALFLSEIHFIFWLAVAFAALFAARRARRRGVGLAIAAAGGVALSIAAAFKSVALPAAIFFFAAEGAALLLARPTDGPSPPLLARFKPWLLRGAVCALAAAPLLGLLTRACTRANRGEVCVTGNKVASDFLLGHYGRIANLEVPGLRWASGVNRQRSGLMSTSGVPSTQSSPRTTSIPRLPKARQSRFGSASPANAAGNSA